MSGIITIKADRVKPIVNRHPWVFSGAVERIEGNPEPGAIVTVVDAKDRFLGRGYFNPNSQIIVRMLTWQDEPIDDAWWRAMLERAIAGRALDGIVARERPIGYRVVNAENDYLPGLIVDRYGDWLVIQALTLGIDERKSMLAEMLADLLNSRGVYERSDVDVRKKEGLRETTGLLWGEPPPERLEITEGSGETRILVDLYRGHKTGFYLDQRPNRLMVRDLLESEWSGPCRLLNLFSYTGGFAVQAMRAGGVHAISVDSSREALELAEANIQLNELDRGEHVETYELIQANVFEYLRDMRDNGEEFDFIILDPPKFAQNAGQVERAARGYKDLNLNAFRCMRSGGLMMTFSCSGAISADLFQKIVFGALADSGRQAQILRHLGPGDDHPVALTFPEGAYLKGLLLRVY